MNALPLLLGLYTLVVGLWVLRRLFVVVLRGKIDFLTPQDEQFQSDGPAPLVSIVIPAKDEEETIGGCLDSVLAQTYPNLEVIVIDDRSRDRTAGVVERIARRDSRVRLLRGRRLPFGWTGKTHALVQGAWAARGDWLWFLDADTRHRPEALSVMIEFARREGDADMVSTIMGLRNESFWERVVQPLGGIVLVSMFNLLRANRHGETRGGFANGQSILVRRTAYDAVGGHVAVRDQFLEDVHLGRLLKSHGFAIKIAMASRLSTTRMYTSLKQIVHGWSRIYYGASDQRAARLIKSQLSLLVTSLSAYVVPIVVATWALTGGRGPILAWAAALSLLHVVLVHDTMYHLYGFTRSDRRYLALYPLSCLMTTYILARACAKCFTHRVTWRGTRYRRQYHVHTATEKSGPHAHAWLVHR